MESLAFDERQAMLAHEQAHLRHRSLVARAIAKAALARRGLETFHLGDFALLSSDDVFGQRPHGWVGTAGND